MASVINDPNGRRRIQFTGPDGRRRTVRLGKISRKDADGICRQIELILNTRLNGQPLPRDTALWVTEIGDQLRDRLTKAGLLDDDPRAVIPTLQEFIEDHLNRRTAEVKASTMTVLRQAARWLLRALPGEMRLDEITTADADRVRLGLLKGRARATANKWTRLIREFFNAAVTRKIIETNPFGHIRGLAVVGDRSRQQIIPASEVQKVMEVVPCPQFRAIIALARWGGLRCPTEVMALRWSDVNLAEGRMIVRASKTEHHEDGGIRIVPIFAELRPYLETLWEIAGVGEDRLITRYREGTSVNLRTQLNRWCLMAGVRPWKKPYQNMRATRATELADRYPSHVCAAWLGHTEAIADAFYRMVRDEHFQQAATEGISVEKPDAKSDAIGAQNAAQQIIAVLRALSQLGAQTKESQDLMADPAILDEVLQIIQMGATGFEPVTDRV
ncbi:integrase family protein : Uncharacterized protein OS=Blastopirellula marina DSM 3645 GN=DSM3645_29846 PE=4 SV=1: Phage_integrase [Tuwongella immobilis]|uniref:Tyr recombinase domain-containing protein n=1 Tax=Tuwongella immobilis TaxID=692036 RepID=A0A6C2YNK6_9BACT|nr:integrase family protein : Uncharacterized protein OS=Blastopirellula marina DSM 3645 GN=DSM3645_29846 PE=4 SV=1: Phage_integrase [Tuwongella immobilis]VTS03010.1 integrase family protein : Uncharacterized protein OS=Blastopirellula marina DSM 3645 GN=DSM3645_29846 PE=4 SV=1: Phage_integrase [Tuwongella immobilis]